MTAMPCRFHISAESYDLFRTTVNARDRNVRHDIIQYNAMRSRFTWILTRCLADTDTEPHELENKRVKKYRVHWMKDIY